MRSNDDVMKTCANAWGKHHAGVASDVIILNVHRQQGDFQRYFYFLLSLFYEWENRKNSCSYLILFSVLLPTRLSLLPDKTDIFVDYECCWLFLVELRKLLNYIYVNVNCKLNLNRGSNQDLELHFKCEHKEVKV